MGLSYIAFGFIFFFLPNLSIIDILPDFIGCLLISKGLYKLSDLTPGLMDAKKAFTKVLYLSLVKFALMFSVPYFANSRGGGGYVLIFTFSFAVLDMIFTLPAFKALLNGFLYLGDRTNASVLFENHSEFSTLTTIFLIVRAVFALIPDLSYVSNPEYSNVVSNEKHFYVSDYKTLLTGINLIFTTIIGIVWLVYAFKYFNGIKKDKALIGFLEEKYKNEILSKTGLFIYRDIKKALMFLSIGAVFMLDLNIDLVNVIPDFLGALFILYSALVLKKYLSSKAYLISSTIFLIASLLSWGIQAYYAIQFPAVNIWSNFKAYELFVIVNIASVIKYISLAILLYFAYKAVNTVIYEHMTSPVGELHNVVLQNKLKQKQTRNHNITVLVLGLVCVVFGIIKTALLYDFGEFALFDTIINLVWIYQIINLLNNITSSVEYRYL